MSTFIYTRPSDNFGRAATVTVNSGTEDTAYPASNLIDLHPEKPAKLTTTSGSWVFNLGSAQRIDMASLIHHNLSPGLEVRLQGNATNVWTAPSYNQTFTIGSPYADFFPPNPWINMKKLAPTPALRTFQYWRLVVVGANAAPVSIGEFLLIGNRRDLGIRNIKLGSERMWRRPATLHETDLLVRHTYDFGTTVRAVTVEIQPEDYYLNEVQAWWRDARGIALPFIIVPHEDENDAWMVTFVNKDQPYVRQYLNYNPARLAFQELSRGLYP